MPHSQVAPAKDQLQKFVTRCHSLDCHKVADGLQAVIEEAEEDKRILRTLHVVQALARSDIVGIETCLASLKPVMVDLCSDDSDKIRNKAGQVLRGLEEQNGDLAAASTEVNDGPQADLLTLDEVRDRVSLGGAHR